MPVVCIECGSPRCNESPDTTQVTWDEFHNTDRCAYCDRTWHLSACEDCKALTCEACWENVGCIECANTESKED
jgi:hypothetical protein